MYIYNSNRNKHKRMEDPLLQANEMPDQFWLLFFYNVLQKA